MGVFYWKAPITEQGAGLLDKACSSLNTAYPAGFSGVHLFSDGVGLPDAEVRKQLQVVMSRYGKTRGCMAIVMLGGGFLVSALQSLITGLRMFAGPSPPLLRFAREVHELRGWLPHEHLLRTGQRIDEAHLMAVIQEVQALGDRT